MPAALLVPEDHVSRPVLPMPAVALVRVRPVPLSEPPYDGTDDPGGREPVSETGQGWVGDGSGGRQSTYAGMDGSESPGGQPGDGAIPPHGSWHEADRLGRRAGGRAGHSPATRPLDGRHPARAVVPMTARQVTIRFVGICLEVLDGFRPVAHLRRLTAVHVFDTVAAQLRRPAARVGHPPYAGAVSPRPGSAHPAPGRIRIRHVQIGQPARGVIEAVAVLGRDGRAWALALRLENRDGTWLCTHLEVV